MSLRIGVVTISPKINVAKINLFISFSFLIYLQIYLATGSVVDVIVNTGAVALTVL